MDKCPLCDKKPEYCQFEPSRDVYNVECERCGRFRISEEALDYLKPTNKTLLSAYSRRRSSKRVLVEITSNSIEPYINSLPRYTPPEKLDNFLQMLADKTVSLGDATQFDPVRDYPLLIASGVDEINYLIIELQNRGYLSREQRAGEVEFRVTMSGWERLEEIRRAGRHSSRAFVAMWFSDCMDQVYKEAIAPAISDAGYEPLRIDQSQHVNRIDDEIIGQIKRSRFLVADFTGQRRGVYFEAGMMLGLGRTVIWMCRKEELDKKDDGLHFDVRQFNFIAYETVEEARKRLYERILAIEGEGPSVTPKG